jgi:hypothetical protein
MWSTLKENNKYKAEANEGLERYYQNGVNKCAHK